MYLWITINDNINGLQRLDTLDIEAELFKKIQSFTQEENLRLFKEFKSLDDKLNKGDVL